jgi:hypothetical protein
MATLWVTDPNGGRLVRLAPEAYVAEGELQSLVAEQPEILADALDREGEVGAWLLIGREVPILAEEEGESRRWRLDHLFLDRDGTPVLVEVKRSSNPQARREVVGQMLDYAASFGVDWSAERVRSLWESRARQVAADDELDEFLSPTPFADDHDAFWAEVQTKMTAGHVRLVFVADRLAPTLVRIVEFLNQRLDQTEVLGIEVLRHAGADGRQVYEAGVRGRTSAVPKSKGIVSRRTPEEFYAMLLELQGPGVVAAVRELVDLAAENGVWTTIGKGAKNPILYFNINGPDGHAVWPLRVAAGRGRLGLDFAQLRRFPAFATEEARRSTMERLASATGQAMPKIANLDRGKPFVPLAGIQHPGAVQAVREFLAELTAAITRGT